MNGLWDGELVVSENEVAGIGDGFQVGARARGGRVVIRTGLGVSMSQEAALTVDAARRHAEQVIAVAAGIQGRKALAIAEGTMALFDLAADVEACFLEFPGLDAMTDADWANVDRVLRALPGSWPLLRGLWDAAGKELSGGQ